MTKILRLPFPLPTELQQESGAFSNLQFDTYGAQVLEILAKENVATYYLDNKTLEFISKFMDQEFTYYITRNKPLKRVEFKFLWLMSGILLRQLDAQAPKLDDALTPGTCQESNQYARVMYKIQCSSVKLRKIFKIDAQLYADPITVTLENMQFIKEKWNAINLVERCSFDDRRPLLSIDVDPIMIQYCLSVDSLLARLFKNFKLPAERYNYEKIGELLLGFPFVDQLLQSKELYDYALVFLYGCLIKKSDPQYKQQIENRVSRLYLQDKKYLLQICLKHLLNNQSRLYVNHVAEISFREQLLNYILNFLSESKDNTAKIELVNKLHRSFDATTRAAFGHALEQSLRAGATYNQDLLFCIYDLRLGLRNFEHMSAQMRIFANKFNLAPGLKQEISRIVPEDTNQLSIDTEFMQKFDTDAKRLLACTMFGVNYNGLNHVDCVSIERYIFILLKSLRTKLNVNPQLTPMFYSETCKSHDLSLIVSKKLLLLMNHMLEADIRQATLKIKFYYSKAYIDSTKFYVCKIVHATLKNLGAGNWVLHSPDMPQEYIRIDANGEQTQRINHSVHAVARYLVDSAKTAWERIHATMDAGNSTQYPLSALITARYLRPKPLEFRRSLTPLPHVRLESTAADKGTEISNALPPFRRVFSTPQFGPSGWF